MSTVTEAMINIENVIFKLAIWAQIGTFFVIYLKSNLLDYISQKSNKLFDKKNRPIFFLFATILIVSLTFYLKINHTQKTKFDYYALIIAIIFFTGLSVLAQIYFFYKKPTETPLNIQPLNLKLDKTKLKKLHYNLNIHLPDFENTDESNFDDFENKFLTTPIPLKLSAPGLGLFHEKLESEFNIEIDNQSFTYFLTDLKSTKSYESGKTKARVKNAHIELINQIFNL